MFENRLGVAWYRPEQWDYLKSVVSDMEIFEEDFDEWWGNAERRVKILERKGVKVKKVDFDVNEWLHWCKANNKKKDAGSRVEYVVVQIKKG